MEIYYTYSFPIGYLSIAEENSKITKIIKDSPYIEGIQKETPTLKKAALQLSQYFQGLRKEFDLPLEPQGTAFQKKVWQALLEIPYAQTRTYKQIAESIDNPKGFRAVGMANNRNPIVIVIPCHRVIGSDGSLVGYGGGLEMKESLLALEKANRD